MSRFHVNLPGAQFPSNAMLNFDPLSKAIGSYKDAQSENAMFSYKQQRDRIADQRAADATAYSRGRDALQDARYADELQYNRGRQGVADQRAAEQHGWERDDQQTKKRQRALADMAGLAQTIMDSPEQLRGARYEQFRRAIPDFDADMSAAGFDPNNWEVTLPALVAKARGFQNPLDVRHKEAQIGKLERDARAPGTAAPSGYRWTADGTLEAIPGGPQDKTKPSLGTGISGGLNQLARIPSDFRGGFMSDPFGSAVGSIRGQDNDGGWLPSASGVGKVWGSITNMFGDHTTSEVRNRIKGDTEALAAAIKPLIRAPGEGPWTDKDQERLVAVVGNLALANNEAEYKRALEGVRDRVMSNFGIVLPPIEWPGQQGNASSSTRARNPQTGEEIEWNGSEWVPVR